MLYASPSDSPATALMKRSIWASIAIRVTYRSRKEAKSRGT